MSKSFDIHKPLDLAADVSKSGNRSWAITVKEIYCEAMLRGEKTAELRLNVPNVLNVGDVVYVIKKESGGRVVCRFTVAEIIGGRPWHLRALYKAEMAIDWMSFYEYTRDRPKAYLIRFEKLQDLTNRLVFREDLGLMFSPQWFSEVKGLKVPRHERL